MRTFNETLFPYELDDRKDIEKVFTSWVGIIMTVLSATVSTLASILVIRLILSSTRRLYGSIYHRILFGMSVADIIQSIAMAFTSLPMPTDMIYTGFQGLVIGNKYTCNAQGYLITIGAVSGMVYNAMLSVYYLCSINFIMTDHEFHQCLEPFFHMSALALSLVVATLLLVGDLFNPSPTAMAWCGVSVYPYWLLQDDDENDNTNERRAGNLSLLLSFVISTMCITTIVASMIMIVAKVRKRDQQRLGVIRLSSATNTNDEGRGEEEEEEEEEGRLNAIDNRIFQHTKIIRNQAIAYSIVNLFGFAIMVVLPYTRNISGNGIPPTGWQLLYLVLRPLQGLFNSCIFVYHKAYNLQRENNGLNISQAFFGVLAGCEADERVFSNLNEMNDSSSRQKQQSASDLIGYGRVRLSGAGEGQKRMSAVCSRDDDDNSSSQEFMSAEVGPLGMERSVQDLSGFSMREECESSSSAEKS